MTEARSLLATIDPRRTAVVECSSVPQLRNEESAGSVAVLRYTPERVWMRMDAVGPALLVAADGHHSGWHATIDGRERASTVSGSRHARSTHVNFEECQRGEYGRCSGVFHRPDTGDQPVFCMHSCHRVERGPGS